MNFTPGSKPLQYSGLENKVTILPWTTVQGIRVGHDQVTTFTYLLTYQTFTAI